MSLRITSLSLTPSTIFTGKNCVISVGAEVYGAFFDAAGAALFDSTGARILTIDAADRISAYTGEEIDTFANNMPEVE